MLNCQASYHVMSRLCSALENLTVPAKHLGLRQQQGGADGGPARRARRGRAHLPVRQEAQQPIVVGGCVQLQTSPQDAYRAQRQSKSARESDVEETGAHRIFVSLRLPVNPHRDIVATYILCNLQPV